MVMTETLEKLEAIVRPHLKFLKDGEELGADRHLGELGLDSMASIDLLLALEEGFGISIDDERLTENSFATLREIGRLVEVSG